MYPRRIKDNDQFRISNHFEEVFRFGTMKRYERVLSLTQWPKSSFCNGQLKKC